ncbi:MAG: rod shape-determining protein RodA [Actinomycetes bacterium]|jgi:rod shape determining protein RodA|nr:MAG: rod shape-determining protein RodA [Actinomycetota bacterium]
MMTVISRLREVAVVRRGNKSDRILIGAMVLLSAIGLMMIYSATRSSGTFSMERQMIFVAAGMIILLVVSNIDYREYRAMLPVISVVILVLLGAVFLFDPVSDGGVGMAYRWIPLGFFNLQPSEFAKVAVILVLASLLSPQRNTDEPLSRQLSWKKLGLALLVIGVPGIMIYEQPDLGTALVFAFVMMVMVFAAGATWRQMLTLIGTAVLGAVVVVQMGLLSDYQMRRIQCLFDPVSDPEGACYQLRQSIRAIGAGQLFGTGFLADQSMTSFEYVPEQQTDFIFTAVAEQFGLLGSLVVLACFAVIVWRLLVIAAAARDRFGALIAVGVAAMMMFHVFVNIGMTIGIMPVTGIPLPFLSQGGSFYMAMALALGIANSVWLMRTPVPSENQLL